VGDTFVAGSVFGRVRALFDDKGKAIKRAGPATPVEVVGSADLPDSGDRLVVVSDERMARQVADQRAQRDRLESSAGISRGSLEELYAKIAEGDVRELKMVLKGDVHGSVEAVKEALGRLARQDVHVQVLHDGVGAINESDITLASASQAVVVGFNVRPTPSAKRLADVEGVEIRTYRVIYELLEEIEAAMKGLLAPTLREVILGHAEVRQVFHVSKIGTVAGLYVTDGKLARSASVRLVRDGTIVHEGKVDSLRRFKDDAREVTAGMECGLTLDKFNDFKVGDTLEVLTVEEVPVT
ncbi:MAG: translation initiation factor IF-2, partial [Sulfobacillus sp.]